MKTETSTASVLKQAKTERGKTSVTPTAFIEATWGKVRNDDPLLKLVLHEKVSVEAAVEFDFPDVHFFLDILIVSVITLTYELKIWHRIKSTLPAKNVSVLHFRDGLLAETNYSPTRKLSG